MRKIEEVKYQQDNKNNSDNLINNITSSSFIIYILFNDIVCFTEYNISIYILHIYIFRLIRPV